MDPNKSILLTEKGETDEIEANLCSAGASSDKAEADAELQVPIKGSLEASPQLKH